MSVQNLFNLGCFINVMENMCCVAWCSKVGDG